LDLIESKLVFISTFAGLTIEKMLRRFEPTNVRILPNVLVASTNQTELPAFTTKQEELARSMPFTAFDLAWDAIGIKS
jgi:pyrroline-5-carboxylate reductase